LVDATRFPLVVSTFPELVADDDLIHEYIATMQALVERRRPFVHLIDCRSIKRPADARRRKLMTDWVNEPKTKELNELTNIASAIVVNSAVVRGALTAALWVVDQSAQMRAFSDADEATAWLIESARSRGLVVPSR
jgi:hypothetical protein